MKHYALLLVFLTTIQFSFSQSTENFERLISKGEIPNFFVKYLDEKIAQDKEKLEGDKTISNKNARVFSAVTNFKLQQLIQSGRVLYGDPLTNYANKVLDKLKAISEEKVDHVQIFTLKSNEVNAFATHQGVIFITVGLWGQIENEAQLAFVIAHELTHVTEKHNQLSYQHSQEIFKRGRYGDDKISSYYQYSKSNENDADEQGYKLALAAGYPATALYESFNVLLYSYLPIDEIPVKYDWIENEGFKIPENLFLDELNEIAAEADVDDKFHTHPNIASRRSNIKVLHNANKEDSKSSEIFQVETKDVFNETRELARFEMMNIFIRNGNLIQGLYHNYILQQKYSSNKFVENTGAMCWYALTAFENSNSGDYSTSYRKVEGEQQQLYYLLHKIKDQDLAVIATKQIWEKSLKSPDNAFLTKLRKKVLQELCSIDDVSLGSFALEINSESTQQEDTTLKNLSKYDKIASKKKKKNTNEVTYYAFLDIIGNTDFINEFADAEDIIKKRSTAQEEANSESRKPRKSQLDINSLIMTTPNFFAKDNRKSVKKNISKNEDKETKLTKVFENNSDKLGIKLNYIDNFKDPKFTTNEYNDFSLLYDYLGERYQYSGLHYLPYNSQFTNTLIEKYGSEYVGMVNIYTEIDRREFNFAYLLVCAASIYGIPIYLKWQLTADKSTEYSFSVYDLETHNPAYFQKNTFYANMNIPMQSAHLYHLLNQITQK